MMKQRMIFCRLFLVFLGLFSSNAVFSQQLTVADTARVREEVLDSSYPSREQIDSLLDFDVKQWDIWQKLALRQINDSEYSEAEKSIENALKYAPKHLYSDLYLSFTFTCSNQEPRNRDLAVKYADLTIASRPNYWASYFAKAMPFMLDSMYKEPEASLKKAIEYADLDEKGKEIKPKLIQMLGYCIHKNGRSDEGLTVFNSAPTSTTASTETASDRIMRAEIYEDRKEYEKAIADVTEAQSIDPNPYTLKRRCLLYEKAGKINEAFFDAITAAQGDSDLMTLQTDLMTQKGVGNGNLELKVGMKLTYMIDLDDNRLVFTIKQLTTEKIVFDYQYTNNDSEKGTITLDKKAISTAKDYTFSLGGEEKNLVFKGEDDTSILFLSFYGYENLVENKMTTLILEDVTDNFTPDEEQPGLLVLVNGKWQKIATQKATGSDEGAQLEMLANPKFPLIVSSNQNFKIRLLRVD